MAAPTVPDQILEQRLPCSDADLEANMAHAMALGLPDSDAGDLPLLNIVATGPSAALYDFNLVEGPIVALNGALRYLLHRQVKPDYWCAIDPQPIVARFLPIDPPRSTSYRVASQCHASVFTKLRGRDLRLIHVGEAPRGHRATKTASSVTLLAIRHFRDLGWRRFRTFGWDCCFLGGEHHATPQDAPQRESLMNAVLADGSIWPTTATWALETHEAADQFLHADYEVEILGPGMVAPVVAQAQRELAAARAAMDRRRAPHPVLETVNG